MNLGRELETMISIPLHSALRILMLGVLWPPEDVGVSMFCGRPCQFICELLSGCVFKPWEDVPPSGLSDSTVLALLVSMSK